MYSLDRVVRKLATILIVAQLAFVDGAAQPLSIRHAEGGGVELTWPDGKYLQSAPTVKGPWTILPTTAVPHLIHGLNQAAFFRTIDGVRLTVTKAGTGAGTVTATGDPAGIDCGVLCSKVYPPGASVTLKASPAVGSTFASWSGDAAGTADATIVLDKAKTVTATFITAPAPVINPIVNGDFEQGPNVGWAQEPAQLVFPAGNLGGAAPFSGQYATWLGYDKDGRRLARLGQRVTLPAAPPLFLNFAAWVYSEELCDVFYYDAVTIYLNGQKAYENDRLCKSSNSGGWGKFSLDVSALAGQSVAIVFEIYSSDNLASAVLLDDIAIAKASWAP